MFNCLREISNKDSSDFLSKLTVQHFLSTNSIFNLLQQNIHVVINTTWVSYSEPLCQLKSNIFATDNGDVIILVLLAGTFVGKYDGFFLPGNRADRFFYCNFVNCKVKGKKSDGRPSIRIINKTLLLDSIRHIIHTTLGKSGCDRADDLVEVLTRTGNSDDDEELVRLSFNLGTRSGAGCTVFITSKNLRTLKGRAS